MTLILAAMMLQSVEELIERLGEESIDAREEAQEQLRLRGRSVLPALREAERRHPDSEVRGRATHLIRHFCRIPWRYDLEDALILAANEKKPLFIFFEDPEGRRFPVPWRNEALIDTLRDRFVPVWEASEGATVGRVFVLTPEFQELFDPGNPEHFMHELVRVAGREPVEYTRAAAVKLRELMEIPRTSRELEDLIRKYRVTIRAEK